MITRSTQLSSRERLHASTPPVIDGRTRGDGRGPGGRKGTSRPQRRDKATDAAYRISAPRWWRSEPRTLLSALSMALSSPGVGRLEAEREGVADAAGADLLAAVDVEQPELGEQRAGAHARDAQQLADRACLVDDHRQVAVDRLGRGIGARATLGGDEVEQPVEVDRRVHRASGEAPGLDDARMHLAERPVRPSRGVDDERPCGPDGGAGGALLGLLRRGTRGAARRARRGARRRCPSASATSAGRGGSPGCGGRRVAGQRRCRAPTHS